MFWPVTSYINCLPGVSSKHKLKYSFELVIKQLVVTELTNESEQYAEFGSPSETPPWQPFLARHSRHQ